MHLVGSCSSSSSGVNKYSNRSWEHLVHISMVDSSKSLDLKVDIVDAMWSFIDYSRDLKFIELDDCGKRSV